jgi:hypothetical protein
LKAIRATKAFRAVQNRGPKEEQRFRAEQCRLSERSNADAKNRVVQRIRAR